MPDHFYTTSAAERDNFVAQFDYAALGTACSVWDAVQPGTGPLYRLYNPGTNDHFYTTSQAERDNAVLNAGYQSEGTACFVFAAASGNAVPFYRTYNQGTGDHFYTTSVTERDASIKTGGYVDEGIACYVLNRPDPGTVALFELVFVGIVPWPGGQLFMMSVWNGNATEGSGELVSGYGGPRQEVVQGPHISFTASVGYGDSAWADHGTGFFSLELLSSSLGRLDFQQKTLGDGKSTGDWSDTLTVTARMSDVVEQFTIKAHCELRDNLFGADSGSDMQAQVTAVQGPSYLADFSLDFLPVTIVYCPPGQDMTASLTQSESLGTRLTLGAGSGFESVQGEHVKLDLGIVAFGVGGSDSASGSSASLTGVQFSYFRNTVLTADNQKAVGRAYWGPLNDIFVVGVRPLFTTARQSDGTILYSLKDMQDLIVAPAWRLLRPVENDVAGQIPADVRLRLLQLDPFIQNLNLFFPNDTNADLQEAANPFPDPRGATNRALLLGRWWLDNGTELAYSVGESYEFTDLNTNELQYKAGVTVSGGVAANTKAVEAGLGVDAQSQATVSFQQSKETRTGSSRNAACSLIRNQNDRNTYGIELYYDKIFSTFMFRQIPIASRFTMPGRRVGVPGATASRLHGTIRDSQAAPLRNLAVLLRGQRTSLATCTDPLGRYEFIGVDPGRFELLAGDQTQIVQLPEETDIARSVRLDLAGVRRRIDLATSPVWEVASTLGIGTYVARSIISLRSDAQRLRALAALASNDPTVVDRWRSHFVLETGGESGRRKVVNIETLL